MRVVYKYLPVHEVAVVPGLAVCAAHQQGQFTKMKDLIWEEGFKQRQLEPEKMEELAQKLGLDMDRFRADMQGDTCQRWIGESKDTLAQFGVTGTPSFFINGRILVGAQPLAQFKKVVDEELAKARQAPVPPEQYYEQVVMQKGLKSLEEPE